MTPEWLADQVRGVVVAAADEGELALSVEDVPAEVVLERPRQAEHGDYATNIAMRLAKPTATAPRAVAEVIASRLREVEGVDAVEVAGPGFINISVSASSQGEVARQVVLAGSEFGTNDALAGERINVEYISANPTGPLHLGHTRWAAVGDALVRVLRASGAEATSEFYINDRGVQMDRFGASLLAAARGLQPPEDGYHGGYVVDLAAQIAAEHPEYLARETPQAIEAFREDGYRHQLGQQRAVLEVFRTHFDVWTSERDLHRSGSVESGLEALQSQGHVYEHEGALWLRTSDFGDDKDRVLRKSDGELTYFASDCAYYVDKRNRGFERCIYLLGADHHGYVGRLQAVAAAAGDDPGQAVEVLIGQLVKIMRAGEEVRLSKRAGQIVTLEDLVDEVGVDAARYSLIRYPADSPLTLDLDVLVQRNNDNPVFYVQYAHARISSVLRHAQDLGIDWAGSPFDAGLLDSQQERDLLGVIAAFPGVVATAAELREPHRVTRYLEELAGAYHKFYDTCRVLPRADESTTPVNVARLWLCAATRQTLANGLDLLGVSAPERM